MPHQSVNCLRQLPAISPDFPAESSTGVAPDTPTPAKHRLNFTKAALQALPAPATGRAHFHDAKMPGLVLSITAAGCRSFLVYRKLNARPVRVTLGRFPPLTVEQACRMAATTLARLAEGVNSNAERRTP